jgi:hypothetical protein
MDHDIDWKCLGDEYLLIRGAMRRVVSSDLWWATLRGAAPTKAELEQLWRQGLVQHDVEDGGRRTRDHLALVAELKAYIADAESELKTARAEAAAGQLSKEEVRRQEALLESVREQLRAVELELRGMVD